MQIINKSKMQIGTRRAQAPIWKDTCATFSSFLFSFLELYVARVFVPLATGEFCHNNLEYMQMYIKDLRLII